MRSLEAVGREAASSLRLNVWTPTPVRGAGDVEGIARTSVDDSRKEKDAAATVARAGSGAAGKLTTSRLKEPRRGDAAAPTEGPRFADSSLDEIRRASRRRDGREPTGETEAAPEGESFRFRSDESSSTWAEGAEFEREDGGGSTKAVGGDDEPPESATPWREFERAVDADVNRDWSKPAEPRHDELLQTTREIAESVATLTERMGALERRGGWPLR